MSEPAPTAAPWRLSRRPTPWLGEALAGGAGALIGGGVLALASRTVPDDGSPAFVAALVGVALAGAGYVLVTLLPVVARPVCTAAVAFGVAGAAGFVALPDAEGIHDLRLLWGLLLVGFTVCYFAKRLRYRSLFLALAVVVAWVWILAEVATTAATSQLSEEVPVGSSLVTGNGAAATGTPNWGDLGLASALFGLTCLGAVIALDRRGRFGVPPALTPIGVVSIAVGVLMLGIGADNGVVGGSLAVLAGIFVGTAGAWAHRRFTVWSGAAIATVGAAAIALDIGRDDRGSTNMVTLGLVLIAFGVALSALALVVARILGESGNDDTIVVSAVPPPVPPAPDPAEAAAAALDDDMWAPLESGAPEEPDD